MNTDKRINRLRKLRAHFYPEARAAGNPKEAALARKMFDRLLLKWGLSLADVEKGKRIVRTFDGEFEAICKRRGFSYQAMRNFRVQQVRLVRRDLYAHGQSRNPNAWYTSFRYGFNVRFAERIGELIRANKPGWWEWDEYSFGCGQQAANAFPLAKELNPSTQL